MANFYPEHLIEEIKQANDIVEVLGEFLQLKKRGANYLALCPFHNEKTPSFSVSPSKQIYHCFGCGKGGNVYTFLMEHENLSFVEAVQYLAKRAGIQLPKKEIAPEERSRYEHLYFANQVARNFFIKQLWETEDGKKVLKYLKEARGLSEDTINHFELGFAPDAWDKLLNHARTLKLSEEDLVKAGLVVEREDGSGHYDRFRRRLIFPILNFTGKPIAFGGRALSREDKAKYINSPETDLYNKSKVLYGLNFSRPHIRKLEYAILVEGYMDLLALWQGGFQNVVASSGTAFTSDHARLISRYAPTAIMLFDSDDAGIMAAKRCAPHLMAAELDFKVVLLPEGEDPDSYLRNNGSEKLREMIENALSFPEFIYNTLGPSFEKLSSREKENVLMELVNVAAQSDSSIRRELFLKESAAIFDIDLNSLKNELARLMQKGRGPAREEVKQTAPAALQRIQLQILAVLIENMNLLEKALLELSEDDFSDPVIKGIYNKMLLLRSKNPSMDVSYLLNHISDPEQSKIISQASNMELGTRDTERLFSDFARRLKALNLEGRRKTLISRIASAEKAGDLRRAEELTAELKELTEKSSAEEEA
ncbi:MAG TPA: DNA primase [candidate division Zixibacteria bacterium]|nr:DNA primase [candidate division Zixibacteria bacterium]